MEIINYTQIKDKIKKYSSNVSCNLERVGFIEVFMKTDAVGRKSRDIVKKYHQVVNNPDDTIYLYRRIPGDCGLPLVLIYVKI